MTHFCSSLPHEAMTSGRVESIAFRRELASAGAEDPGPVVPASPSLVLVPRPAEKPPLPSEGLRSGHVWPPTDGRLMLAQARPDEASLAVLPSGDWAGSRGPWRFYASVNSVYGEEKAARTALLGWARWHTEEKVHLAPQRCLSMVTSGAGGWRLWQTLLAEPPLAREVEKALRDETPATIVRVLLDCARLLEEALPRLAPARLPVTLETVGVIGSRPVYVGSVPSPEFIERLQTHAPLHSLDLHRLFAAVFDRCAFSTSPKRAEVADRLLEAARTPAFEERALSLLALVTGSP